MTTRRRLVLAATIVGAQTIAGLGLAEPPDAGAPDPADAGASVSASCVEHLPEGATRPRMTQRMLDRGTSGYAIQLEVTLEHGKGETVLPSGFDVQRTGIAHEALKKAGFALPEVDGGSAPTLSTQETATGATTTLRIPFVPLPEKPGRNGLVLPPVPVAVARASGEVMTLCTAPQPLLVEDPIANEVEPKPRPNPPPRPQRETWEAARTTFYAALAGVVVGAALLAALSWWRKRPKVVPPPPPVLPWLVALTELDAIRRSTLLEENKTGEFFDRVSDAVRKYLGGRYGYDGLESTTDEALAVLARVRPPVPELDRIRRFLEESDLVKFAKVTPTVAECGDLIDVGEQLVRRTIPEPSAAVVLPGGPS